MCSFIENKIIGKGTSGIMSRVKKWLPIIVSLMLSAGIYSLFTLTQLKHTIGIDAHKCFVNELSHNERKEREITQINRINEEAKALHLITQQMQVKLNHKANESESTFDEIAHKFYLATNQINNHMQQLQVLATGRLPAILYVKRWHVAVIALIMFIPFYILFKRLIKAWLKKADDTPNGAQHAFKKLQIGTSCYVAFAIGSNDVANSISPVLAIYLVAKSGGIPDVFSTSMPVWILILGGAGMAAGISLLGKRVMKTLGERLTKINNARGFCIDFSVATSVVGASAMGIPVSTTHAATGAVVGSGLSQSRNNVQFKMLGKIASGWLITIPFSAVITVIIYEILIKII